METIDQWTQTLMAPLRSLWVGFAELLPSLLAAVAILVIGYLVARMLRGLLRRLLPAIGVDRFSETIRLDDFLDRANVRSPLSTILSVLAFWLLMLLVVISAAEVIGLPRLSMALERFLLYLPRLFGALVIVVAGLFVAGLVRDLVRSTAEGVGIDYAASLGSAAYGLLLILVVTLAIGQLDLETQILNTVIAIVILSAGVATALAFGLGARDVAANILAGTYVRELYRQGDRVRYQDIEGEIRVIGAIKTVISCASGEVSIANSDMVRHTVSRLTD